MKFKHILSTLCIFIISCSITGCNFNIKNVNIPFLKKKNQEPIVLNSGITQDNLKEIRSRLNELDPEYESIMVRYIKNNQIAQEILKSKDEINRLPNIPFSYKGLKEDTNDLLYYCFSNDNPNWVEDILPSNIEEIEETEQETEIKENYNENNNYEETEDNRHYLDTSSLKSTKTRIINVLEEIEDIENEIATNNEIEEEIEEEIEPFSNEE